MQKPLILCALTAFSACDQVLFVEVDIPELCQETVNQTFDAMPQEGEFTVDREFEYPMSENMDMGEGFVASAQLKRLVLKPGSDTDKLDFIRVASVELKGPDTSTLPSVKLLDYDQSTSALNNGAVELKGDNVDIMPYLQSGIMKIKTTLTGKLPTRAWSTNVQTCISAKAHYPYWQLVTQSTQQ